MAGDDSEGDWLHTDEQEELVSVAEFCAANARLDPPDLNSWRWLIIGSVLALQGAFVNALLTTDTSQSAVFQHPERYYAWLSDPKGNPQPRDRLASTRELLERAKDCDLFDPSTETERRIKQLIDLRDDFIHFTPKGWSIEVSGLPEMLLDCWNLIASLPRSWHLTEQQMSRLEKAVEEITAEMRKRSTA